MAGIGDTVFAMTEWLRTTPLVNFALWLNDKSISEWVQSHSFMVPLLQIIHILAIAMGFGSVLLFNFRLLGKSGAGTTIAQARHRYLPWMWWALVALLLSGIGMVFGDPVRLLVNPVFWIKMILFVAMILLSMIHLSAVQGKLRAMANWDGARVGSAAIRSSAYTIIILWFCIMAGGRYMAYVPM